ncbi:hypothetical protein G6012_06190, partial [Dietzia schimae]
MFSPFVEPPSDGGPAGVAGPGPEDFAGSGVSVDEDEAAEFVVVVGLFPPPDVAPVGAVAPVDAGGVAGRRA